MDGYDINEASSVGLEGRMAAAISYFPIVGLVFYFVEKKSRYVKYHAAYSIILLVLSLVLGFVLGLLGAFLGLVPVLGMLISFLADVIVRLGFVAALIYSAIMAYQGQPNRIPYLGKYAEQMSQNL